MGAALQISDRAYRYRANQAIPEHAKVCVFCGETRKLMVGHLDGHEEHTEVQNLSWCCRSCNAMASNTLQNAGKGRLTRQYNPSKSGGATTVGEWMQAVGAITPKVDRGNRGLASDMPVSEAVRIIRATPHAKRSQFAAQLRKHASSRASARWNPPMKKRKNAMSASDKAALNDLKQYGTQLATYTVPGLWPAQMLVESFKKNAGRKAIKRNPKGKRNPAGEAAELYQEFHGQPPSETVTIVKDVHYHKNLTAVGDLRRLVVSRAVDGGVTVLTRFKGAIVAFSENRKQLFIEGGDQTIDLASFGLDPEHAHEWETLGQVVSIDYHTTKTHLGDEGGTATYEHTFRTTNENGQHVTVEIARYPDLIYNVPSEQLYFSGGSYFIRAEGIDQ